MASDKDFIDYKIGDTVYIIENDFDESCGPIGRVVDILTGGVLVITPQFEDSLFHYHDQVEPIDLSTLEMLIYNISD